MEMVEKDKQVIFLWLFYKTAIICSASVFILEFTGLVLEVVAVIAITVLCWRDSRLWWNGSLEVQSSP